MEQLIATARTRGDDHLADLLECAWLQRRQATALLDELTLDLDLHTDADGFWLDCWSLDCQHCD